MRPARATSSVAPPGMSHSPRCTPGLLTRRREQKIDRRSPARPVQIGRSPARPIRPDLAVLAHETEELSAPPPQILQRLGELLIAHLRDPRFSEHVQVWRGWGLFRRVGCGGRDHLPSSRTASPGRRRSKPRSDWAVPEFVIRGIVSCTSSRPASPSAPRVSSGWRLRQAYSGGNRGPHQSRSGKAVAPPKARAPVRWRARTGRFPAREDGQGVALG